jgi:peptidoglycan/xylan/chitin deacetylase (PgdA/CDA1 family)
MRRALVAPAPVEHPVQPGTRWTEEEIKRAVAGMRVGRKLTPKSWPADSRVAVCLSWDMDNESYHLAAGNTEPITLSSGEYGTAQALPRIMELYDRHQIPGSFYIPGVTGLLYPEMVAELKRRPQHEIGIHGWIHENLMTLNDRVEEERLLQLSIDFWSNAWGRRPVGYRAPFWGFSPHTLDLIRKAGFEYDSSAMGMDEPYEIVSYGQPTGVVELPVAWVLDDAPYYSMPRGALPSPKLAFEVYREEFDRAYEEGTLFMLTMHPMITGHRSRIIYLDRLITYMMSKPGVWFATGQQIAQYVKHQSGMSR